MGIIVNFIVSLLYVAPAVLIALSLHEFAHGLASYSLGDPTPKANGRLSLNPFRHMDLWGTLMLLFFGFGWAIYVIRQFESYSKTNGFIFATTIRIYSMSFSNQNE